MLVKNLLPNSKAENSMRQTGGNYEKIETYCRGSIHCGLLAAGIVGNSLCSIYYSQIQAYMQRFVTSSESANSMTDLSKDDAYTQALQLCEEVESEGLVLLKNDNDTLPLGTDKINLFGYNSYKTVYTDYGSGGHHNEDQNFNFIDGFEFVGL